ncbi:p126 [Dendrolimus punctatus cypovirus 22]|uniref:p126 n=1 Tax=Dendrolimus punctatus cypovirus 22 TaxID=1577776 RepID=UPI00053FC4D7|nr:p126 [Dendrolimus punctatus cypovirus 22]AIY60599.1 p126 [Dendrolimus punctatus cypovirus 22]
MGSKLLIDFRGKEDPHPNDYVSYLQNNVNFSITWNYLGEPSARLTNFGKYIHLTEHDRQHPFIYYIQETEKNKYDKDYAYKLFSQLRQSIVYPVLINHEPTKRLSMLLADGHRCGILPANLSTLITRDPSILLYDQHLGQHLLSIIDMIGTSYKGTKFRYIDIPTLNPVIIGKQLNPYIVRYFNARTSSDISILLNLVYNDGFQTCHVETFAFNVFHVFIYPTQDAMLQHCWDRLLESWRDMYKWLGVSVTNLKRRTELLIPLCDNRPAYYTMILASLYLIDRRLEFSRITPTPTEIELLFRTVIHEDGYLSNEQLDNLDKLPIAKMSPYVAIFGKFMMPYLPVTLQQFEAAHHKGLAMISLPLIYNRREIATDSNRIQNARPGVIIHELSPYGEAFVPREVTTSRYEALVQIQPLVYGVDIFHDLHRTMTVHPDIQNYTPEQIAEGIVQYSNIIASDYADAMYKVKNLSTPTEAQARAIDRLILRWQEGDIIKPTEGEEFLLQLKLLNRVQVITMGSGATARKVLTSVAEGTDIQKREINNSTMKMYSLFRYALGAYLYETRNADVRIRPNISILGVEDEPVIDIIKQYYAAEVGKVRGYGDRARVGKRTTIGLNPTLYVGAHIVISDIEIREEDYEENVRQYKALFAECARANIIILKVLHGHENIVNILLIEGYNLGFLGRVLKPGGRKVFSTEIYIFFAQVGHAAVGALTSRYFSRNACFSSYTEGLFETEDTEDLDFIMTSVERASGIDEILNVPLTTVTIERVKESDYLELRDQKAQSSTQITTWKVHPSDRSIIVVSTPDIRRMALVARRSFESLTTSTFLRHQERLTVTSQSHGLSTRQVPVPILKQVESFAFVKLVVYEAIRANLKSWLTNDLTDDILSFNDVGSGKMDGITMIRDFGDIPLIAYDIIPNDALNHEFYGIEYRVGEFLMDQELPHDTIFFMVFVLESPVQPGTDTTFVKLNKLIANVVQRRNVTLYVTYLTERLVQIQGGQVRAPFALENFSIKQHEGNDPNINYECSWAGYPFTPLIDDVAFRAQILARDLPHCHWLTGNSRFIPATIYYSGAYPRNSHNAIFPELLEGISILRISTAPTLTGG